MSRSARSFAIASKSRHETLHRHVARGSDHQAALLLDDVVVGAKDRVVDADRHDGEPIERDVHLSVDVDLGVVRDREDRGQLLERAHLHAQEPEPASCRVALPGRLGVIERDGTIDGDRVMQRLQERPTFACSFKIPGPMHWLSWMMSKSPRRRCKIFSMRSEYASGSPKRRSS